MLSLKTNIKLETSAHDYARALRAIGQDLARLLPEHLEIEVNGRDFVARGRGTIELPQETNHVKKGSIQNFWNKLICRDTGLAQPQPQAMSFERTYTPEDINRLDEIGVSHRTDSGKIPDIQCLGEKLRTIGKMIDSRAGHLVKLSNTCVAISSVDVNRVAFQYRDKYGEMQLVEYSTMALSMSQEQHYSERGGFQPKDASSF